MCVIDDVEFNCLALVILSQSIYNYAVDADELALLHLHLVNRALILL